LDSPTYGEWISERLSGENHRQLYVPPGFAHGFYVLSETAHVQYKCTELYHPNDEIVIAWDDPAIGIQWDIKATPILSDRDKNAPKLAEIVQQLRDASR
jgi:dTDP-4-dehydrorhamnose 3,5-epimerase